MSIHRIPVDRVSRFVVFERGYLNLQPRRPSGESFAGVPYELEVLGMTRKGKVAESGVILEAVPRRAKEAMLRIFDDEDELMKKEPHEFEIVVEEKLPPVEEVRGVQRRLVNLGFDVGDEDGEAGPKTRAAVRAFEEWTGLKSAMREFGELGEITREAEITDAVRQKLTEIERAKPGLLHGAEFEGERDDKTGPAE